MDKIVVNGIEIEIRSPMDDDLIVWLRHTQDYCYGAVRCGEAADEIERLRLALNSMEKTMAEATETIKTLMSDLKTRTLINDKLEAICARQHAILVENKIFPSAKTTQ